MTNEEMLNKIKKFVDEWKDNDWVDTETYMSKVAEIFKPKTIKLIVEVPEELLCKGFEQRLTEEDKCRLIKAIGNAKTIKSVIDVIENERTFLMNVSRGVPDINISLDTICHELERNE